MKQTPTSIQAISFHMVRVVKKYIKIFPDFLLCGFRHIAMTTKALL